MYRQCFLNTISSHIPAVWVQDHATPLKEHPWVGVHYIFFQKGCIYSQKEPLHVCYTAKCLIQLYEAITAHQAYESLWQLALWIAAQLHDVASTKLAMSITSQSAFLKYNTKFSYMHSVSQNSMTLSHTSLGQGCLRVDVYLSHKTLTLCRKLS